jgi:hypothetical protein
MFVAIQLQCHSSAIIAVVIFVQHTDYLKIIVVVFCGANMKGFMIKREVIAMSTIHIQKEVIPYLNMLKGFMQHFLKGVEKTVGFNRIEFNKTKQVKSGSLLSSLTGKNDLIFLRNKWQTELDNSWAALMNMAHYLENSNDSIQTI